jgi:NNP family nitrate/nitrite transporter-like MFS transporter
MLADKLGGYRTLRIQLATVGVCLCFVATLPPAPVALGLLAFGMAMLGMGNGSVFQLVPQRFPDRVGIMTGIVGAAGTAFSGHARARIIRGRLLDRLGTEGGVRPA